MRTLTTKALIRLGKWEKVFAWLPVIVGDEEIWLEFVMRKPIGYCKPRYGRSSYIIYEYREVPK